ncbi:MAG: hypothetical protein K6F44_04820 [Lachnospiraceae bacterium]|nr:hypothetical protein [Lachnospiraceae bacterium]
MKRFKASVIWSCILAVTVLMLAGCNRTDYFSKETVPEVAEPEVRHDPNAEIIVEGETKRVPDVCEVTLDHLKIAKDVKPADPGSVYSQYSAGDDKVYVDMCLAYKNLDTSAITAYDTMKCTLVYADKYEYSGFSAIEVDDRRDFESSKNASISPLSTEYMHYLFEVPDEVRTSGEGIDVYLTIGDKEFKVEADPKNIDTIGHEEHPGENATEVKTKEVITTENAEFNISYVTITDDVVPSNPADYYAHFEADQGKLIVDMSLYYRNISSTKIGVDRIGRSTLVFADKYEYAGFVVAEKNDGSEFTDADVTSILPLETGNIHYLFMVPQEIKGGNDPVYLCFTIDGQEFKYVMR